VSACPVCRHPLREAIDNDLRCGWGSRWIRENLRGGAETPPSRGAIKYHARVCMKLERYAA
jgi:hypothetical protein